MQYWAQQLANDGCKLKHSGGVGENLYANYGYKPSGNCVDGTKLWYAEESKYQYSSDPCE